MKNVKVSLAWQILLALVLGILLGSYLHYHSDSREWLIANLLSPSGLVDVVCGSAATLIAALITARVRHRWLAPLPAVLSNGVIIGAMLAWYEAGFGPGFWGMFAYNGLTVALGELGACYVLGMLLLYAIPKIKYFQPMLRRVRC